MTDVNSRFVGIDLDLHAGEIVGLYGLVGAGRSELAQTIFGLAPRAAGRIAVDGVEVDLHSPADAVAYGIAYLPEDRLRQGALRGLSVQANAVLGSLRAYTRGGVVDRRKEAAAAAGQAETLGVRMRSAAQPLGELSGGNQQKVILARWLLTSPRVLILDEPTRGIDVAAKAEIHELLARLAEQGVAILLITSDLPEALAVSQRLVVARRGRLVAEFDPAAATAEQITQAALPDAQFHYQPGLATKKQRLAPRGEWGLLAAIVALGAALSATTPQFLSWQDLAGVASEAAVWTILALAAAMVILAGAIDISLGSLLALAAGVSGMMLRARVGGAAAIPLALGAGLGVGLLGGLLNAALALGGRVHPIVITLGTMTTYRGLLILLTGGDTIGDLPPAFGRLATAKFAGVEAAVLWLVGAAAIAHVGLTHSVHGRHLVAYGNSPSAARLVGISQRCAWLAAFAAAGLLTGAAGLLSLARAGQMQSGLGAGYELQAIAAAVIGGVSIAGGRGSVLGVVLGALLLSLLYNALVLWQVSVYRYDLVIGGLLLAAVVLDRLWRRWSE